MTHEETLREITRLIPLVRRKAAEIGPQHAFWDVIFDGEALLKDEPTLLSGTPEEKAQTIYRSLKKYDRAPAH